MILKPKFGGEKGGAMEESYVFQPLSLLTLDFVVDTLILIW